MLKLKLTKVHFLKIFSTNKNLKVFLLLCLSSLAQFSCNTTEPIDDLKPGRRDYTWTVDTLILPFNPFTDITGTSPTDLWVCSPGDADKIFYHYDGNSWTTDNVFRVYSPKSVYSLGTINVWSSGREGRIWNYSNNVWNEIIKYSFNNITDITFEVIYCKSNDNIITAGQYFINEDYYGIILKYDGKIWNKIALPEIRTAFADIAINNSGKIYLWGVSFSSTSESTYQFYELNGLNLKEIYSGSQSTHSEDGSLLQLGSETYFIIGFDFFSYNGSDFQKVGRLTDSSKFRNIGAGRNKKDVFLFMTDGIMHYNGEDAAYLYQTIDKSFVSKAIIFEKEVFFLGRDINGNNLIFHGKLNE
jgi:hypothetical protein